MISSPNAYLSTTETYSGRWAIIINPKSGKSKYRKQRKYLFMTLKHAGIEFDYKVTRYEGHAVEIARIYAELGYKKFMVLGGDGSMSEVINGIFSADIERTDDIRIALVPRGTGNDWGRFWGLTRNYKRSIEVFLKGYSQAVDVGRVRYKSESELCTHYFINSLGLGLDAQVVDLTHRMKRFLGSHAFLYTVALLGAVFSYRARRMIITADEDQHVMQSLFTMSIANGCYSGGGIKQTPNALPYDGQFDVMMARKPSFWKIVTALRYLFQGRLLEHPIITSFRTTELTLQCDVDMPTEADGILLHGKFPYQVDILPNAIQMIIPNERGGHIATHS